MITFIEHINRLSNISQVQIIQGLGLVRSKYYQWLNRSKNNCLDDIKPIAQNPSALLKTEKEAICNYYMAHQGLGYRALTYMMIDDNVVCSSPSTVYRCLKSEGMLIKWNQGKSLGNKPPLPTAPNQKWHTDLMYLKIDDQFYYYQAVIDAYSRYIIAWDIHAEGSALNTSLLLQEAFDSSPQGITPDIIADNGKEFLGKEFREVVAKNNGKKIKIKAYHPQSNGIDERHHRSLREECTNHAHFSNLIEAKNKVGQWIKHYNTQRLHSAIEYMAPIVWHQGNPQVLKAERNLKIKLASEQRKAINLKQVS